jgi:hypothetical protein
MLSILKNHPPVVVAYVAGVIEAKASVGLTVETARDIVYPSIEIYHKSADYLYLLQSYIGGTVTRKKRSNLYKLLVRYQKAADVLKDIEPYCLILKPLIKKVVEYQSWLISRPSPTKYGAFARKQTTDKYIYEVIQLKIEVESANSMSLTDSRFIHPVTKKVLGEKLRRLYGGELPPEETDTTQD